MPKKTVSLKNSLVFVASSWGIALVLVLTVVNLNISFSPAQGKVLGETVNLDNERAFWQELVTNNPSYYEAWIELSEIEDRLGNATASAYAKVKAIQIKPNSF